MARNTLLNAALMATAAVTAVSARAGKTINGTTYAGALTYGHHIFEVSADITIPDCSDGLPANDFSTYTSDGWVGLDAYNLTGGLIQTGVTTDFQVGDVIRARVVADSPTDATSGSTYLENLATCEKFEKHYTNQNYTLAGGNVQWVVESQLYLTVLGPEGQLGARYTPWVFENAKYKTKDGDVVTEHILEMDKPEDHLLDTILGNYTIAKGIFDQPGKVQVNYTTPDGYVLQGYYP
ncbi:hypothetical protein LTR62_000593 [Meristemomyces frigidus]|uniref:Uncharacterized protein n=1 Tax=Meristemomyces frigidus TaxID=1508187 RepID=A0AAN7YMV1_9PEZI|nr:hypothetical protein LTR62_000593 [Meristemomyces frigidus]